MYTRESDGLFDNFEQQHIFSQDVYPFFNPCLEQEAAPGREMTTEQKDSEKCQVQLFATRGCPSSGTAE